jgi:hypothetical protein
MRRRARDSAEWQPPPEWFTTTTAGQQIGHENAVTRFGEIDQSGFAADVARRASWRRVVGLLVVLVMLAPVITATALLIARLR